uniref:Venom peptide Ht239 n=1 Tax=Hadogenes troglodytes TaxID=1577150 RepID=A0A1B3IJ76_9SCOR|nr:venom peptide Ht239 [Hadogenes troglodytes]
MKTMFAAVVLAALCAVSMAGYLGAGFGGRDAGVTVSFDNQRAAPYGGLGLGYGGLGLGYAGLGYGGLGLAHGGYGLGLGHGAYGFGRGLGYGVGLGHGLGYGVGLGKIW